MPGPDERAFETGICAWLRQHGGYDEVKIDHAGGGSDFDPATGLDRVELLRFLSATQQDAWEELVRRYRDADFAQVRFRERLAAELDRRGVVDVLRHGVVDQGVALRLAAFKPAYGLSPERVAEYAANRVTLTRQLRCQSGSNASLDLALLVNGIVVATAELKNPLTARASSRRSRSTAPTATRATAPFRGPSSTSPSIRCASP